MKHTFNGIRGGYQLQRKEEDSAHEGERKKENEAKKHQKIARI
jgi:hypothetical protein